MTTRPISRANGLITLASGGLLVLSSVLFAGLSFAIIPTEHLQTSVLHFGENTNDGAPQWEITDSNDQVLEIKFTLPALELNQIQADGRIWQTLNIEGAVEHGSIGEPGLPVISRLIAVPRGMTLSARLESAVPTKVSNLQILPVQDPAGAKFSYSMSVYENNTSARATEPEIRVGGAAILAGQTVVPLTIRLVDFDTSRQEATVWTEVILKLEFVADPKASATSHQPTHAVPASFSRQMQSDVLGYQLQNSGDSVKSGTAASGLGTYVAVHSGQAGVSTGIAPLLQWRREQGYHVIEFNSNLSGNTTTAIKDALQDIYNDETIPPLEFISIFGDASGTSFVPTWTETLSGYNGGGDHYYTMLDGDDILADAHIGRVSFGSLTEMNTIIGKILGYEKTPPMDDTGWYGRACLQGDPSASGITTIYTNQWVKGQLQNLGWSQVDTTWSGNFVSPMMAQVGQGVTAYGYRGYLGTSGITNGHVTSLTNGGKLAMALLPTCASGSFANQTARSEAWLRAPNGGAVAAIGTATTGTHTRYNNCYYLGTWDGLLNRNDYRIGTAHTLGKIALYTGYYLAEPARAEIWAVWNNIMGDPATEMWTGVPRMLDVDYPAQISIGGQAVTISVSHLGSPVVGAQVCLYRAAGAQPDIIQITGLTDSAGQVVLNLPDLASGSVTITVTGHNFLPHLGGLTVGLVDVFCGVTSRTIDDGGDGFFNPGENVDLTAGLTNHGTSDAFGVTAELTLLSGPASVSAGSLNFGTITAGDEVYASTPAVITMDTNAVDGATVELLLTATDGQDTWTSLLEESVRAAAFSVTAMDLSDFGGSIDPGETGRFDLTLENLGSLDAGAVSATLSTNSPWVIITDGSASFGSIDSGSTGRDLLSPFRVSVSSDSYGGHLASFELTVSYNDGLQATTHTVATIGISTSDQPTGPDAYGYYAFDNTDAGSQMAPEYNWVGIDPDHGGQGTDLGLTDFGWEQDDTKTIRLPFDFGFYGDIYEFASICSNGWLAMGGTPVNFYRNFPLPASHSAGALIAPFWDNLNQTGNKKVYTWYDEVEHRFIIQWYEMPNHYTSSIQNFEVILLDPDYHPTTTGDGMIIFQYAEVHNTDSRDGYATVGIQNMPRTDGINYSYWNQYAPGAAPLAAGRAILFAPMGELALPAVNVTPGVLAQTLMPGDQITEYLHIANNGDAGSILNFTVNIFDPATVESGKSAGGQNDIIVEPSSLLNSEVSSTTVDYDAGSTIDFPLHVICHSPDDEWLMKMELDLPDGVTVNSADDLGTPHGPMAWNGQTGNGVITNWGDVGWGSGAYFTDGESGDTSVNLSFDAGLSDDVVIGWTVFGDEYGGAPHQVSGQIVLTLIAPFINVSRPSDGEVAVLGETLDVVFTAANGPEIVSIDLQRQEGGTWENLAYALNANTSPWSWNISGEPGPYARIRVRDSADSEVFGLSGVFAVSNNLDWLQLATDSGQVNAGEAMDLAVVLDSAGLNQGVYEAGIAIASNGGPPVVIPVTMTVSDASSVGELPGAVALLGNHPNPFNPQTIISFALPTSQDVTLRVYSARGALIRSLLRGVQPAGLHRAVWDGRDDRGHGVASGVYFYRLETDEANFTGKMVLTK